MNKSNNNILSWVCSGVTCILAGVSVEQVTNIILLIIGILSALVSLAYNIYVWYNKAKQDGKITKDEVKELKNEIDKTTDKIQNDVENSKKEKK